MMEIKANSKLDEVFENYPHLEQFVMTIAPAFQNLKNPILRRTVGKLATIEKIARIGNIEVNELINQLRREVGQTDIHDRTVKDLKPDRQRPEWVGSEPVEIIDGNDILNRGKHPLQKINRVLGDLESGQYILLKTNFKPLPMIDEMTRQKYEVYSTKAKDQDDQFLTFIRK